MTNDFDAALGTFVDGLRARTAAWYGKNFPSLTPPALSTMPGQRYVRIVKSDGTSRSVWGFIDTTNGDILKAAGWKAPAKHARGNIFNANQFEGCGVYGPAYIKGPNFDQFAAA